MSVGGFCVETNMEGGPISLPRLHAHHLILAALNIGAGVEVTFGDGLPFAGEPEKFGAPALVPEPSFLVALVRGAGMLGFTRFRSRNAG